jgi:pimeloyl-ACP methyl ester carboxylesterase
VPPDGDGHARERLLGGQPPGVRPLVADVYGRGRPVVLLHGQPGSSADWSRVGSLLADDFLVVAPDRPGYGRTGGPATGFAGNAEAAVGLMDRLGIPRAVFVGHSWGGGAAIAAAELHPDRVSGLVLVASVGPGEHLGWEDRILATPLLGEVISAVTIGATGRLLGIDRVQALAGARLAGRTLEAVRTLARSTGARSDARVWQSFVHEQRHLISGLGPLGSGLAAITAPTAVVNGGADRVVPPSVGEVLSASIRGATYTVLPAAHHLLPLYEPEVVAGAVRDVAGRGGMSAGDSQAGP